MGYGYFLFALDYICSNALQRSNWLVDNIDGWRHCHRRHTFPFPQHNNLNSTPYSQCTVDFQKKKNDLFTKQTTTLYEKELRHQEITIKKSNTNNSQCSWRQIKASPMPWFVGFGFDLPIYSMVPALLGDFYQFITWNDCDIDNNFNNGVHTPNRNFNYGRNNDCDFDME